VTRHGYSLNLGRSSNVGLTIAQEVHFDSIFHTTLSVTRHGNSLNLGRSSNVGLTIGQEVHIDSIFPSTVDNILDAFIFPSSTHYF